MLLLLFLAFILVGVALLLVVTHRVVAAALVGSASVALAVIAGLAILFNLGGGFFVFLIILVPLAVWIGKWEGGLINKLFP
jgi:hypothetical protein